MFRCLTGLILAASLALPAAAAPKLNAMRVLGSHNSYRPPMSPEDLAAQRARMGPFSKGVEYAHLTIAEQLDIGLRQMEFDPYADAAGGRFAAPYADDPAALKVMSAPGAKVLHVPTLDRRTHCLTLADCFAQTAAWSRAHPGHEPIMLLVNTKEDQLRLSGVPDAELFTEATWPRSTRAPLPPSAATASSRRTTCAARPPACGRRC